MDTRLFWIQEIPLQINSMLCHLLGYVYVPDKKEFKRFQEWSHLSKLLNEAWKSLKNLS